MLLRGETNFFVRSLRHYSVLILIFVIWNVVTKLKYKSSEILRNLRNQRTLRYLKNSLQLSNNSTEISNVKLRRKNNGRWIYSNTYIIAIFFRLAQTLCNLVPEASSLFDVNAKKRRWRGVWTLCLLQDLPWRKGCGSCFECGLFGKSAP